MINVAYNRCDSSMIKSFVIFNIDRTKDGLLVKFTNDSIYLYVAYVDFFSNFVFHSNDESVGKLFNAHVKPYISEENVYKVEGGSLKKSCEYVSNLTFKFVLNLLNDSDRVYEYETI